LTDEEIVDIGVRVIDKAWANGRIRKRRPDGIATPLTKEELEELKKDFKSFSIEATNREAIATNRQTITKERQDILTKQFYSIFNKQPLPLEKIDSIFKTYLADGSLTVEKSKEGISYPRINSMTPVIRYLDDNPDVPTLDFRSFKSEVHDVKTLAVKLKNSTIRAIAIKKCIPEEAKASLADVVAIRNGTLKVQYFD
jgi:hypothetical protein